MNRQRPLSAFPHLDPRQVTGRRTHPDPLLSNGRVRLYASGRAGLFRIVAGLALPPGSTILLPAYHCGVEVEAVLRAGCGVAFYRVRFDLGIDLDHIRALIDQHTRGILVAHYFGFPQEISELAALCRQRELVLIEDCAHALYSRDQRGAWLGTTADYGLFSMRKTVFMPNGGAVRVNRAELPLPQPGIRYLDRSIVTSTVKSLLEYGAMGSGVPAAWARRLLHSHELRSDAATAAANDGGAVRWYYDVPSLDYRHAIAALSRWCAGAPEVREIVGRRRENYRSLAALLAPRLADRLPFPELPEGVCPLCLPLFVPQRDAVAERLAARGVHPFVFGRHPHPLLQPEQFPEATVLAAGILGLPVQQQLTERDMALVADILLQSLDEVTTS